jgi:hypothetical protein
MEQNTALAALDAKIMAGLARASLTHTAKYRARTQGELTAASNAIDCQILVDRSVVGQGADFGAASAYTTITAFAADIGTAQPANGSQFFIPVTGETFAVDRIDLATDESRFTLVVRKVPTQ